jgi:3,4-dihydroxy 2-butanone 4-phosphate synthase/GTP cyclohydrolase II
MRLAGLRPAAGLAELVNDDGSVMSIQEAAEFAKQHELVCLSVDDLVSDELAIHDVTRIAESKLPTRFGSFRAIAYIESGGAQLEHIALTHGHFSPTDTPLVRLHSECLTGDSFGSLRCDCGVQLAACLKQIGDAPSGAMIYLRGHEGRGIGLANKIRAYALQDEGTDTVDANLQLGLPVDSRLYYVGAAILHQLGIHRVRLLTNNPKKVIALQQTGLEVERVPMPPFVNPHNRRYLSTKRTRLGHLITAKPSQAEPTQAISLPHALLQI